jgi:haloacetate dehalogenase
VGQAAAGSAVSTVAGPPRTEGPTPPEPRRIQVGEVGYHVVVGGSGPPVLLLHGFPQTHHCWRKVVPQLAPIRTVVLPDLRGYGGTAAPPGGPRGEGYSKREMAAELVALMKSLGFERFAVVGHDRGARVAYRMALDHPDRVERLGVLNVLPTVDQFERMTVETALDYYPWFFLAQPAPLPERLVGPSAEFLVRHVLESWCGTPGAIDQDAAAAYVRAFTPATIAAVCADYRAAFHLDRPLDAADRSAGRRIACPVLVLWGDREGALADGPLEVWRRWASDVRGHSLPCGHFLPEEAPEALAAALEAFLAGGR